MVNLFGFGIFDFIELLNCQQIVIVIIIMFLAAGNKQKSSPCDYLVESMLFNDKYCRYSYYINRTTAAHKSDLFAFI